MSTESTCIDVNVNQALMAIIVRMVSTRDDMSKVKFKGQRWITRSDVRMEALCRWYQHIIMNVNRLFFHGNNCKNGKYRG